jgi:uncharacterized protein YdeI (YjbR/CyaY-like superfamily)
MKSDLKPKFFKTSAALNKWLQANHTKKDELIIGFYKVASGRKSITPAEALDEMLCFGWIDGIRHKIDEESYQNRYTPRKANSTWSQVNIKKVKELINQGRMQPAGMDAYNSITKKRINKYSFEQKEIKLEPEDERKFKRDKKAWEFFQNQPPSYRKPALWWVVSAKRDETQARRLKILIEDSKNEVWIKELRKTK